MVTAQPTCPFGANRLAEVSAHGLGVAGVVVGVAAGAGVAVSAEVEAGDAAGGAGEPPREP
jgi:hypothetical protein